MPHLPRRPVLTQPRRLSDLPELAAHVITIKLRADGRSKDQAVILPERTGYQAVGCLMLAVLAERVRSELWQQQDPPTLLSFGVSRSPLGTVDRDRAAIEVDLTPLERPNLFSPQPC